MIERCELKKGWGVSHRDDF